MPGHYGDARITTRNLKVVNVLADKNCILVAGSVPGANSGYLEIHPAS
jgi:large subunit ribosomal protein L3